MKIWRIKGKVAKELAKAINRGKQFNDKIKCWQLPDIVTGKMVLLIGYGGPYQDLINSLDSYIFHNCNCGKEKLILEPIEEKK